MPKEIYDHEQLGLREDMVRRVEDICEEIADKCIEALESLKSDTERYVFLSLISSFRDKLKALCINRGGKLDTPLPVMTDPTDDNDEEGEPEEVDLSEGIVAEIENITDEIEPTILRTLRALPNNTDQANVLSILVSLREEISKITISGIQTIRMEKQFETSLQNTDTLLGLYGSTSRIIRTGPNDGCTQASADIERARARNFSLPEVIDLLYDPKTLSKEDLKDIFYFLIWKGNFKNSSTLAAEMTRQYKDKIDSQATAIGKNGALRAYTQKGRYTDTNLKVILALNLVAEDLLAQSEK